MMRRLRPFLPDLLLFFSFLLLPLLLYAPVTLGGRTMLPADNLYQWEPWAAQAAELGVGRPQNPLLTDLVIQNYAWKRFAVETVQARDIPLWNPYLFAGMPFLATGQHSMLYPFSWLFLLLPIPAAYGWYALSQVWLAGALMYLFGRVLQMRRGSALVAGLVYQGSGFLLASTAVFPMISGAAVWLPLLLACIELVIRDWRLATVTAESTPRTPLWVAIGSIALGLQILAGHIEITYYTLLVMGLYALFRLLSAFTLHSSSFKVAGWLLGMVLAGLMLGGIQFVPFLEVGQANFRSGETTLAQVRSYAYPVRHVLAFAMPNFYGNPTQQSYRDVFSGEIIALPGTSEWGIKNYVEGAAYLGILPLFLVLIALLYREPKSENRKPKSELPNRRAHTAFFAAMSLLALAFIFGTPLYALIYYGLPFADQIRTPFRWVFPLTLFVAVLAGFGMDGLAGARARGSHSLIAKLQALLIGLAFGSGLLLLAGLAVSWLAYGWLEPLIARLFRGLALADLAFPDVRAFYSFVFWQVLVLALLLLVTGGVLWLSRSAKQVRGVPVWVVLAATAVFGDLTLASAGFNAAADPALLTYKPALVEWLQQQPGHWRITTFAPHGDKPLNANSAWLASLQDVRGYDSIIPKQFVDYMTAVEPQNELPYNRIQPITNWESLNSPLLDVLNVKYIVTAETIDLPKLRLAWEGDNLRVYENLAVAPRAYTLPQTSTVLVDDALAAMTAQYDPRSYVVLETRDRSSIVNGQLPIANRQSPTASSLIAAEIVAYSNREVMVRAKVAEPAWLVLNDSYFPGWKAYVRPQGGAEQDETEVAISRVNGNFRGVLLEPGAWQVRFRYSPASFQLGALLSAMGLIVLAFGGGIWGWRAIVRPNAPLTTTRSIAKNSAAPMLLNLFNKGIDFVFAMFYLRVLGPADAGSFATAVAAAGIFDILANFGLDLLLIREVAKDRGRASSFLLNSTILRLGAALVASLPMIVLVASTNLFSNPFSAAEVWAIGLIMLGMVFSGMSKGVTGLFYVYERAEVPAAMTTATTILKVGFGVAALLLGYGFVGLAAVSILTNLITLAALALLAARSFTLGGPWRVDWRLQGQMVRLGFPLMLIHLLQTVFISVDVYLLRLMLPNGEEVVGWYSSAYKWFNALQIVPSFFTLALFPIISREIERSIEAARRMYQMALKVMLLLALPIAAFATFLAYPMVQLLGGAEFLPHGAIALQIVIWSIPIGWLNSVTNYVLIALGLERMQPRAFALAVGFNIGANVLFIPRYGYVAAGVTTILSEMVLMGLFAYYLRQRMPGVDWRGLGQRPLLLTLIMVGLMWAAFQVHVLLATAVGLIVYPLGLWALRILGADELKVLRAILPTAVVRRLPFLN